MRTVPAAVSAAILLIGLGAPASAAAGPAAGSTPAAATETPWSAANLVTTTERGVPTQLLQRLDPDGAARLTRWVAGRNQAGLPVPPKPPHGDGSELMVSAKDAATGKPLEGLCVAAYADEPIEACSEGSTVTLTDLPTGPLGVVVSPRPERFYLPDFSVVTVAPDQPTTHTAALKTGGVVTTTVTARATGEPVNEAMLVLRGAGGATGFGMAQPGPDGAARTHPVAPGQYRVFAGTKPDTGLGHQWVGSHGGTGQERYAAIVTVRAGESTAAPAVRLDQAGTLMGTLVAPDGNPAPDAFVSVESFRFFDALLIGLAVTDQEGVYEIPNLGPYDWGFRFMALTEVSPYPDQWTGGVPRGAEASTVRIRPGATRELTTRLARGTVLKGSATAGTVDGFRSLTFADARTGEIVGRADGSVTEPTYSTLTLGGNAVKAYGVAGTVTGELLFQGWHDNARTFADAATIVIPHRDSLTVDLRFPTTAR